MNADIDLYEILGIDRTVDGDELKAKFRELSKIHHPDVGGDSITFQEIREAYDILSDPVKRKAYDVSGIIINETDTMLKEWIHSTLFDMTQSWLLVEIDPDMQISPFPEFVLMKIQENKQNAQTVLDRKRMMKKSAQRYMKFASKDGDTENVFVKSVRVVVHNLDNDIKQHALMVYKIKLLEEEFAQYDFESMGNEQGIRFVTGFQMPSYGPTKTQTFGGGYYNG